MKPSKSILDATFTYTPAATTTVEATWRKFGWKPLSERERAERRRIAAANQDAHASAQHDSATARVVDLQLLRTA